MLERVKLDNGWEVELERSLLPSGYTIEKISARFDHGFYFPLDLTKLTQEQWDVFHNRVKEAGVQ